MLGQDATRNEEAIAMTAQFKVTMDATTTTIYDIRR